MNEPNMSASQPPRLRSHASFYFGKIASRGDFVRSTSGANVIALFDHWFAQGMELLIAYPDWKDRYDNAGPVDFLFIGTRGKLAICGCLMPSRDASSRRFPFTGATLFETAQPLAFLPLSPLLLERHISHQRALVRHAASTHDAADTLAALGAVAIDRELALDTAVQAYQNFLADTSLAALADALAIEGGPAAMRRTILALGLLLQPLAGHAAGPQKGIALPLPGDPARLALVKALWLDLVSVFLPRAALDLSIFSCVHGGMPKLIVAFNGTTPSTFRALFDAQAAQEQLIEVVESEWVEEFVQQDQAAAKLAGYLEHGSLSLRQMMLTFQERFSG